MPRSSRQKKISGYRRKQKWYAVPYLSLYMHRLDSCLSPSFVTLRINQKFKTQWKFRKSLLSAAQDVASASCEMNTTIEKASESKGACAALLNQFQTPQDKALCCKILLSFIEV